MRQFIAILVFGMLFTGTINTILNKLQDLTCVNNCDGPIADQHFYEQPMWQVTASNQTLNMFLGEALCYLVYYLSVIIEKYRTPANVLAEPLQAPRISRPELNGWKQLYFLLPTLCDLTSTTLMNVGLFYISASIYQMLRGSVVIFTGVASVLVLGKRHPLYRWFSLFTVCTGVLIVGLSGFVQASGTPQIPQQGSPVGILFVVMAQCFTAMQFVIEEKILTRYKVPALKAVGIEGICGLVFVGCAVPAFHYTLGVKYPGSPYDMFESMRQIWLPQVWYSGVGIIFSIAFFNWFGLTVTTKISATARSTIDTCRTMFIWMVSLSLGWESFKFLQVPGFLLLIYGTLMFNDKVPPPYFATGHISDSEENEPLVTDDLVQFNEETA